MENDKSQTHVKVQKNGIEGWLHKTTWDRIGQNNNKEGWVLVPTEPAEVLAVREQKKMNQVGDSLSQEENAIAAKSELDPTGEVKQLSAKKAGKKK